MLEFPGYRLTERVFENPNLVFYRGVRESDGRQVLLKTLKGALPGVVDRANFKNELEITRRVQSEGILTPIVLETDRNRFALVTEDFPGRPLDLNNFMAKNGLVGFLKLTTRLARILGDCHQSGVAHRNLRPHNILVDLVNWRAKLMGFRITPIREPGSGDDPKHVLYDLAYISPEQTGRLDRVVDHRTDFYSLGVILYQLLVGEPPFTASDPMTLVHAHIAMEPEPPCRRDLTIPRAVSDIVMKLLAKSQEDRYQSGFGLAADAGHCTELLENRGMVDVFPLGRQDVSQSFHIPHKVYGRGPELQQIQHGLKTVLNDGNCRFQMVLGQVGMGKSELIDQIHPTVLREKGYFVAGRYDQKNERAPYEGFIQAFHALIHQILAESPEEVGRWRERLVTAMGNNGQVIVHVVPDVELIIGKQPPVPVLGVGETQNRFRETLRNFIGAFAAKDHPLVLFLDDLDWAGESSLQLIRTLLQDRELEYLYLIGAGTEERTGGGTGLGRLLSELRAEELILPTLHLRPLDMVAVQSLLFDVLHCEPHYSRELAEVILDKTDGVPLFVAEFLKMLHDEGLLDFQAREGRWVWDLEAIAGHKAVTHCMDDLIKDRFLRLEKDTRIILRVAACIGNRFSLRLLSIASGQKPLEAAAALRPAVEDGLVIPLGEAYNLLQVSEPADLDKIEDLGGLVFKFQHTQAHRGVYSLMDSEQSSRTHLQVGQRFLADDSILDGDIFAVVNQLNQGCSMIEGEGERIQLAQLNLKAGIQAEEAIAHRQALSFFQTGLDLLPQSPEGQGRSLWFELNMHLAEARYFNGDLEAAEKVHQLLLERVDNIHEKVRVYIQKIIIFNNISKLEQAVAVGIEGLELLGLRIPRDPEEQALQITRAMAEVNAFLEQEGADGPSNLPAAGDDYPWDAFRLMINITPPAFNTDQELFKILALEQVRLVLAHGNSVLSPFALAVYGILLGTLRQYRRGYELNQVALKINGRFPDPVINYKLEFIGCNLLNHWVLELKEDIPVLERIFNSALDNGDLVWANYTILVTYQHRWVMEEPLLHILNDSVQHILFAERTCNRAVLESQKYMNHAILNLRGLTAGADTLDTEDFNEDMCCRHLRAAGYFTGLTVYRIFKMQVLYLRGFHKQAAEEARLGFETLHYNQNSLMMTVHYFFYALTLAALYGKADEQQRGEYLEKLAEYRDLYRVWADSCPANFLHKYYLICAEMDRIQGDDYQALNRYHDAVHAAVSQNLVMSEALAHELTGHFHLARGFGPYAELHLQAAIHCYRKWGATSKVDDLLREFGSKIQEGAWMRRYRDGQHLDASALQAQSLDMSTLMKMSHTVSGEFRIDALIKKLMRLVLENAGAQRGFLILLRQERLVVAARGDVAAPEIELFDNRALDRFEDVARSVIHYAFRTRSPLVIEDAALDNRFRSDGYLEKSDVKAILCLPLMRQTELLGILYLENHLARGAFTGQRVEMLRMLAPQIAISLENASYVSEMTGLNQALQAEIVERKKAEESLRKAQEIALANAHNAGKAEFASSVLHNINNVLNSVSLSCEVVNTTIRDTKLRQFSKLAQMIEKNLDDPVIFFRDHHKGKLIPRYLVQLDSVLTEELEGVAKELEDMEKHIKLMKDIIRTQQAHAKGVLRSQTVDLLVLIEDALRIQEDSISRHQVEVLRFYDSDQPVKAEKTQVTHILINLVKNAVEAMGFSDRRVLTVSTHQNNEGLVCLVVKDTGMGIKNEDLDKMFTHGFTTKKDGHGFGLPYCARVMTEMDGSIEVESDGPGKGAAFTLKFLPA